MVTFATFVWLGFANKLVVFQLAEPLCNKPPVSRLVVYNTDTEKCVEVSRDWVANKIVNQDYDLTPPEFVEPMDNQ